MRWFSLFLHDIANNYQLLLRDDALATARTHGYNVATYSAERSSATQIAQIRSVLAAPSHLRPAALLISAAREDDLQEVLREAVGKGVGCILLCRTIDALRQLQREYPKVPAFSVMADQSAIGRLQGRQIRALWRPGDEIVYIQGPAGTSSTERRSVATQRELLGIPAKWSRLNADWSVDGGARAVAQWRAAAGSSDLRDNVILACQNDDMAFGARRLLIDRAGALRGATRAFRILGCDGLPTFGRRLVRDGQLTATVVVPSVAGKGIEVFVSALERGRQPPPEILMDVTSDPAIEAFEAARKAAPAGAPYARAAAGRN